jgi:Putative addiction module component
VRSTVLVGGGRSPLSFAENVVSSGAGAYRERIMSIAEVRKLPFAEKLQIMEASGEDLRAQAEQVPVPQWHRDLLDERRKAVEEGREPLLDWDSIKDALPSPRKA